MEPIPGKGQFQWNKGSWFGSQFGITAWMIVAPIVRGEGAFILRLWLIACFVVLNGLGWAIWHNRYRITPYWGFQALLSAGLIATAAAFIGVHWIGGGPKILDPRLNSMKALYACLLLFPGLMVFFYLTNRNHSDS